jgi:phosphoglycolate phosphatase
VSPRQRFWRYSAFVFDLDGTLADTLPDLALALNHALAEFGLEPVDTDVVRRSLHGGMEASVDAALRLRQTAPMPRDAVRDAYRRHYEDLLQRSVMAPYPAVRALLESLRVDRRRMAICSNKDQAHILLLLESMNLTGYFDVVVGGDTCGQRKPDALPLEYALGALEAPAEHALMVGDSVVDLDCSRRARVDCMIFSGGYDDAAPLHAGRGCRFDSYTELLPDVPSTGCTLHG